MTVPSFHSSRSFARAAALALAVVLWGCGQPQGEVGGSPTLQVALDRSVAVLKGLPAGGTRAPAPEGARPAVPGVPEILVALNAAKVDELERLLGGLQAAYEGGALQEDALARVFQLFDHVIPGTLPGFHAWVAKFPLSYAARVARGRQLVALGWQARGGKWAHETPQENFREMERLHGLAIADLKASFALAQRPFLSVETLIGIARGGGERATIEALFEAGVRVAPQAFPIYRAHMFSLEPRWGGSIESMRGHVARAKDDGLPAREIGWLEAWVLLVDHDAEIRSNPRAAIPYAAQATGLDDRAPRWRERGNTEREHGFFDEAIGSYNRAIELDPDAYEGYAERGYVYERRGLLAEARADYEKGARLGSYYAQERVIRGHVYGELGMKRDHAVAREWCEAAAAMANPWGDFCIGGLYFDGLGGLPKDQAAAFKWFLRAAEKGNDTAQHDVGWMMVQGKGVAPNRAEGIEWLRKSARQGHQYAKAKLEQLGEPIEPRPSLREIVAQILRGL
jgi:TPR repeat protein